MVHSMVAGPHSPCKSVEIVNSMLMNSHHLSNLEKENAAPPRTEVMQYSRDIDTKDSPGIPSISVNNSNTPSEPETELTFPMSRKAAVKDVSTSINRRQTLQDKQDTFNLSTGSSAFNTDHFYSARLPATTSH